VTSSANPSVFGQSVTFTATVTARTPGSGTPAGTATFLDGSTVLATVTLSGGKATFTTSVFTVGSHSVIVQFTPSDGNFTASISSALTQSVRQDSTTTALTSSLNPSTFGSSVTFMATVTANAPGSGIPAGSVTFKDGSKTLKVVTLDASGVASFTTSTLAVGNHTISATYSGSTNYKNSTASLTQVVNPAGSTHTILSPLAVRLLPDTAVVTQAGAGSTAPTSTFDSAAGQSGSMMAAVLSLGSDSQQSLPASSAVSPPNSPSAPTTQVWASDWLFAALGYRKSILTDLGADGTL
jgi:hypothetical protein